jgi:hypothetical protein
VAAFAHTDAALALWASYWATYITDDSGVSVGLYINDYTPVPGIVFGDLTECNLDDYERFVETPGTWSQGETAHVQILTAPMAAVFTTTDTDGQLCYGYFIYKETDGSMLWAQRFDTPQLLVNGVPITFTPREKLKDCPDQ